MILGKSLLEDKFVWVVVVVVGVEGNFNVTVWSKPWLWIDLKTMTKLKKNEIAVPCLHKLSNLLEKAKGKRIET